MESLVYRVPTLRRFVHATKGNPLLTVTFPNEQRIQIPQAVVRWSRGQEFAVENLAIEPHTQARLQHYVKRLVQKPAEIIP